MPRVSPAFDRAMAWLRRFLEEGRVRPGGQLPGVKSLAAEAGVSHVVMLKAVRSLAGDGVLRVRPGAGTVYVGRGRAPLSSTRERTGLRVLTGWQRTREQLRRDLLNGALGDSGLLPTGKELCHRYGVSPPTLRRAISALMDENILEPDRRRYRVVRPRRRGPSNSVIFMFRARPTGSLENMPPRSLELVRELERSCMLAELNLVHVPCDQRSPTGRIQWDESLTDAENEPLADATLGCVVWTIGFNHNQVRRVLARLAALGKPIAVLDETAVPRAMYGVAANLVCVFSMATGRSCGIQVGRFLLRLGHRHTAFICLQGGVEWSELRLDGFREGLCTMPEASEVRVVSPPPLQTDDVLPFNPDTVLVSHLRPDFREGMVYALQVYHRSLRDAVARHMRRRQLHPMLRRVLHDSTVTAWVAANDLTGILCLEFLRHMRVDVPQRISLVAFDDTLESAFNQLTSFNFDYHGLTQRMLDHACGPVHRRGRGRSVETVEIEGFVNERRSTAPPVS